MEYSYYVLLTLLHYYLLLCGTGLKALSSCQDVKDTKLLMALLVHRHADRAAYNNLYRFSNQPKELARVSEPYGEGGLIETGKQRSFELGKILRKRYDHFLGDNVSDDVRVHCTRLNRTIQTTSIAMAAAYSSSTEWREGIKSPVKCQHEPMESDYYMTPVACCRRLTGRFFTISQKHPESLMADSKDLGALEAVLGTNMTLYDLCQLPAFFLSQMELGIPLSPEIEAIMPAIERAAAEAFHILFGNKHLLDLQSGLLIKKFVDAANETLSGKKSPRLRIYSGHDVNVYSLMAATRAPVGAIPNYCAVYALELRRVVDTGEIVVAAVYKDSPSEPESYLKLGDCGCALCELDQFRRITANYTLDLDEFKDKCTQMY